MTVATAKSGLGPPVLTPEGWLGGVVVFGLALTPILGALAPLGFAPLLALMGLLSLPALPWGRFRIGGPAALLILLVLWAVVSVAWSPYRTVKGGHVLAALKLVLQLGLYAAAAAGAISIGRRAAKTSRLVLVVGLVVLLAWLAVESASGALIYQHVKRAVGDAIRPDLARRNVVQAAYVAALLFWPAVLVPRGRRLAWIAPVMAALIVGCAWRLGADAPIAALVLGGAAWLAVRLAGRRAAAPLAVVAGGYFALAPVVVVKGVKSGLFDRLHHHLGASWDARLDIWAFTAGKILQHPLLGWGLDASRTFGLSIPLHPHDAALQLWLELGVVGVILAAGFFVWLIFETAALADQDRPAAAVAAAAVFAYLTIGAVSFGAWQEWWLALGTLTVIGCMIVRRSRLTAAD